MSIMKIKNKAWQRNSHTKCVLNGMWMTNSKVLFLTYVRYIRKCLASLFF